MRLLNDCILILDDELNYAEMLSDLLRKHGFESEVATDPRDALDRLHQRNYALVVTDFKMPEVDGGQFLVEARRIIPHIPVIMVSGLMTTADLLRVANIGVTLVLEKPFNIGVFVDYVRRYVKPIAGSEGVATRNVASGQSLGSVPRSGHSYPHPPRYLVDRSEASGELLHAIWDATQNGARHLLMQLPSGAEFSDWVKEVGGWRGRPGLTTFRFSALEIGDIEMRQTLTGLAKADASSPAIAITLTDGATFDYEVFADFVKWTAKEPSLCDRLVFLHGFSPSVELERLCSEFANDGVRGPFVVKPLRERLVDLAAYVGSFFAQPNDCGGRRLDAEAACILLQHDWPGNHRELFSVLRHACAATDGPLLTGSALRCAIRSRAERESLSGLNLDLESFLLLEQRRHFRASGVTEADLKTLADVAGIGIERLDPSLAPLQQPLLFPELLGDSAPEA